MVRSPREKVTRKRTVALVSGASSRIGKEIARQLVDDKLVVYAAARRVERMGDLETLGAIALKMDITLETSVAEAIAF
jgi:NADP-dependent 3-hydroxy acid dehydrogenase YdfG